MQGVFARAEQNEQSKFIREGDNFRRCLEDFLKNNDMGGTAIHKYQVEAVLAARNMLLSDTGTVPKPALIVAPTGAGKSGMIAMLPYVLQSRKVLILTPSAIVSNQLAEAFGSRRDKENCFFRVTKMCNDTKQLSAFLEDVRVISSSKEAAVKTTGNLVIVNAQKFGGRAASTLTLEYRDQVLFDNVEEFFSEFDTLVVDEAHHYPAKTWKQIVDECKKPTQGLHKKIVFLTATPIQTDRKGRRIFVIPQERIAYTITKEMCEGISIRKMQFDNRKKDDNYARDIILLLHAHQQVEPRFVPQAMVLVKDREQVREVVEELNYHSLSNVNIDLGDSDTSDDESGNGLDDDEDSSFAVAISGETAAIQKGLKDFTAGKHRVAVTCKVGLEGYDNTKVTLCVILRKIVTGRIMFSQFIGRCMRIRRNLETGSNGCTEADKSVGTILSYVKYGQERLYKELNTFALSHPANENDEDI